MLQVEIGGQVRELRYGDEGTLWYWDGGQQTVCRGEAAAEWLRAHLPQSQDRDAVALAIENKDINRRRRLGIYANPFRRGVRHYGRSSI
jgi:hypothetical protein